MHEPKAFFLLHLRAWELLAGAMLAVQPKHEWRASPALAQGVSLASLGLIGQRPATDLGRSPVEHADHGGYRADLLFLVSLALAGVRVRQLCRGGWLERAGTGGADAASLVLGYLSWRFVETPFREKRLLASRKAILASAMVGILGLGFTGLAIREFDGVPSRLSEQALRFAQAKKWSPDLLACMADKDTPDERLFCHFGPKGQSVSALVWGDRHATALIKRVLIATISA